MTVQILALDSAGSPKEWIDVEKAMYYYAKGLIAWSIGSTAAVYTGGISRKTGDVSRIEANSIIAVSGKDFMVKNYGRPVQFSKQLLLGRDRCVCAYCGNKFKKSELTVEHIIPQSRWKTLRKNHQEDSYNWMNVVAACKPCNNRKDDKTPEEAGMPLLYLPYVPNRHENMILQARNIMADQMAFLLQGVPKHSRLL